MPMRYHDARPTTSKTTTTSVRTTTPALPSPRRDLASVVRSPSLVLACCTVLSVFARAHRHIVRQSVTASQIVTSTRTQVQVSVGGGARSPLLEGLAVTMVKASVLEFVFRLSPGRRLRRLQSYFLRTFSVLESISSRSIATPFMTSWMCFFASSVKKFLRS